MRQTGIIAAAGIYALDHHIERLKEDHKNAKHLALGLKEIKGVSIKPDHVETNIVIFDIPEMGMTAPQVRDEMKKKGVLIHPFGKTQIRLVTHILGQGGIPTDNDHARLLQALLGAHCLQDHHARNLRQVQIQHDQIGHTILQSIQGGFTISNTAWIQEQAGRAK